MNEQLLSYLSAEIQDRIVSSEKFLSDGACKDYAHYRETCGFVRGLATARSMINDLAKRMEQADERN